MLKIVGTRGQLTLGKKYSGQHFELEERPGGELVLHPVRFIRACAAGPARSRKPPAFSIAEVEQVAMPSREQRNARHG